MRIPFLTKRVKRLNETKGYGQHDKCNSNDEFFCGFEESAISCCRDAYRYNAWVHIAVSVLIRNIARADFTIRKGGNEVTGGAVYDLFHRPNAALSRYDLWKETAAWWHIEGEAFWWFGPDYAGGLPEEMYVLDPRRIRHEGEGFEALRNGLRNTTRRWFYHTGTEIIPLLADELFHFRDWNPWNPVRGVTDPAIVIQTFVA
jgi:hypothetical protein